MATRELRSIYECMDKSPEALIGGHANQDGPGALFYHVKPPCASLPCPPHDQQIEEMTCVLRTTFLHGH